MTPLKISILLLSQSLLLTSCGTSAPYAIPGASVLFMQNSNSDASYGAGAILFGSEEISCSKFRDALTSSNFDGVADKMHGMVLAPNYYLQTPSTGEAWIGHYSANGVVSNGGTDTTTTTIETGWTTTSETGWTGTHYSSSFSGSRTVSAIWFDNQDGVMFEDSSGLVLEITKVSSDWVGGKMWHQWGNKSFNAQNCGTYDL